MKSYLTVKGTNTAFTWVGLVLWLFLFFTAVSVVIDSIPEGAMSVFAALTVAAPFAAGLILQILRIYHRYYAAKIDRALGGVQQERISYQELDSLCGIQNASEHLIPVLRRGMMENIRIDAKDRSVILLENIRPETAFAAVVCPHCGASNRIPAGGSGRCEYCDQMISAVPEKKTSS